MVDRDVLARAVQECGDPEDWGGFPDGMPSAAARKLYLATKEPGLPVGELDAWVTASKGFSIAHLKEMIFAVKCFDQPLDEVVKRLEEMQQRKPTSEDSPDKMGMGLLPHHRNGYDGAVAR